MTIFTSPYADVALTDLSITERVFADLTNRPDDVVLTDGPTGRSLTAQAFMDQVKSMAGGLTAAGLGAGHTVAIMAPNIPEYCVIFHAVAWAGGTITTLNPTYTANEVAHQLKDADAEVLITIPDFMDTATAGAGDIPVVAIGSDDYSGLFGDRHQCAHCCAALIIRHHRATQGGDVIASQLGGECRPNHPFRQFRSGRNHCRLPTVLPHLRDDSPHEPAPRRRRCAGNNAAF